jgi:uronate dehydrogenase
MRSVFTRATRRSITRVSRGPDSRYGVGKAFGEARCQSLSPTSTASVFLYAHRQFRAETDRASDGCRFGSSPRDYTAARAHRPRASRHPLRIVRRSNNRRSWYDNSNAERLGYRPQDDSEPFAEAVLAAEAGQPAAPIAERYQGGTFCAAEYTAPTPRP